MLEGPSFMARVGHVSLLSPLWPSWGKRRLNRRGNTFRVEDITYTHSPLSLHGWVKVESIKNKSICQGYLGFPCHPPWTWHTLKAFTLISVDLNKNYLLSLCTLILAKVLFILCRQNHNDSRQLRCNKTVNTERCSSIYFTFNHGKYVSILVRIYQSSEGERSKRRENEKWIFLTERFDWWE